MQQAHDYLAEAAELANILNHHPESIFGRKTLFKSWTINDVIGHLYMFDTAALKTLKSAEDFKSFYSPIAKCLDQGMSILESQYSFLDKLSGRRLFEVWQKTTDEVGLAYANADPKKRLQWVGPDMSAISSITARQMETWAHGQEVFDVLGVVRPAHDRIRNICHLGVATFGWSFQNRHIPIPEHAPHVCLTAPSGTLWKWNPPSIPNSITGSALAFSEVVTQVRNIEDTNLIINGEIANKWMEIAQCFAGNPEDPPKKGERVISC